MIVVKLTRPDGSPIVVNGAEILSFAAAPANSAAPGSATRIQFRNSKFQDVLEDLDAIERQLIGAEFLTASVRAGPPGFAMGLSDVDQLIAGVQTVALRLRGSPDWSPPKPPTPPPPRLKREQQG